MNNDKVAEGLKKRYCNECQNKLPFPSKEGICSDCLKEKKNRKNNDTRITKWMK